MALRHILFVKMHARVVGPVCGSQETDQRMRNAIGHGESVRVVVLIVEDEPLVRMLATDIITDAGFVAVEVVNSTDALAFLEDRTDVRIVFTDIDMPGSVNGVQLALNIRTRWPRMGIVITSGKVSRPLQLPSKSQFIPKPYRAHELIATLRQSLSATG